MRIVKLSYNKLFNTGNFENEKYGVDVEINDNDDAHEVWNKMRAYINGQRKITILNKERNDLIKVVDNENSTINQVRLAETRLDQIVIEINKLQNIL